MLQGRYMSGGLMNSDLRCPRKTTAAFGVIFVFYGLVWFFT
jgi:hypothetical protein